MWFICIWEHLGSFWKEIFTLCEPWFSSKHHFLSYSKIAPILSIGSLLHAVVSSTFSCFYSKGCKNYLNGKQYVYKIIL